MEPYTKLAPGESSGDSAEKLKADGLEETVITNYFVPFTQISAHVWD